MPARCNQRLVAQPAHTHAPRAPAPRPAPEPGVLPRYVATRSGLGWVAVGGAAGSGNRFNGEGIDYDMESGRHTAQAFASQPGRTWEIHDDILRRDYDPFCNAARRFAWVIGRPKLLSALLSVALSTGFTMRGVLELMTNLIEPPRPSMSGFWRKAGRPVLTVVNLLLERQAQPQSARHR